MSAPGIPAIVLDPASPDGEDFVLLPDRAAWITSGGFSVWIRSCPEGLFVEIYRAGSELDARLASCSTLISGEES